MCVMFLRCISDEKIKTTRDQVTVFPRLERARSIMSCYHFIFYFLDGSTSMRSKHCLSTCTTDIGKDRQ